LITLAAGNSGAMAHQEVTVFFLSLAVLLGLARFLGELARKYRQPSVLGEILAGVLLGPTVLGYINNDWFTFLFPETGAVAIAFHGLVTMSVALLLLVAGMEVDLSVALKQGKAAIFVSIAGVALPFFIGASLAYGMPDMFDYDGGKDLLPFALFVGIGLSITALPVIAKILMDLNMLKSDIGMLIMAAAMINDLIGWIGFAVILALIQPAADAAGQAAAAAPTVGLLGTMGLTLLFIGLMLTVGRLFFHRVLPFVQIHTSWPGGVLSFVLVVALLCAALTEYIGIHSIFGAFIAGVAMGDSHHLRERTRDNIHQFITNIFAPIFFASIGLSVNFVEGFNLWLVLLVLSIALVGKIGGCYFGARAAGMQVRERWAVGFGMAAQGAMGIILGQLALNQGLITEPLFVAIVIMALFTSLLSGPAMERTMQREVKHTLGSYLPERNVIPKLTALETRYAIKEMAELAAENTKLPLETIDTAVWRREQIMHTGLPHGIAVPHARLAKLEKPVVILARSIKGVDFDAPDGEKARIILMLLTPLDDATAQIELLSLVAQVFDDPETRQRVRSANKATEMLAAISLAESHLGEHGSSPRIPEADEA
jgi:Kef-type K+ transport system membrane component KefB/mannitol/fructose-specific phosphotransferase system IIA component (Ntr-type)